MRRRAGLGHRLATILFTDLVGSSEIASALGDRRWKALLARHHLIVRRALKRHGGWEIDDAGDGFFCSFEDQADAIRCACEISEAVQELGIDMRAGLHVGQAEVVGRKLGGMTVNVAARVMAQAGAAEVLVSGVMRDLTVGSGFAFEDRGNRSLKGIPGSWPVFAVTGIDGSARPSPLEPEIASRRREAIEPPPLLQRRSGRVAAVSAGAVFVAVAVVAAVLVATRQGPPEIVPDSLVRIDPVTGEVLAVIPIAAPGGGQLVAVEPEEIWVTSPDDQVITVVDAESNAVDHLVGGFGGSPMSPGDQRAYGITYLNGFVWVLARDETLNKIDPANGTVVDRVLIGDAPVLLAAGFGRIWVPVDGTDEVVAIESDTGEAALRTSLVGDDPATAAFDLAPNGIAVGENGVWVSNHKDDSVTKIDPTTGEAIAITVGDGPADIGLGFHYVWVSNPRGGTVSKINPATDQVVADISIGEPTYEFTVGGSAPAAGSMWVASPSTQELVAIDPITDRIEERIPFPSFPLIVIAAFGSLWVTVVGSGLYGLDDQA